MQSSALHSRATVLFAVFALASGCSSDEQKVSRNVATRSIVDQAPPLNDVLIPTREVENAPPGSVRRAFLEYWRLLQYQALADAIGRVDPGLVRYIGADQMAEAFKAEAPYFRSVKPRITDVRSTGRIRTVLYTVKDANGDATPRSVQWQRVRRGWRVRYDAFLDIAIRDAVQNATQLAVDPEATEPGRRAEQAGYKASRLQSTYLKQQLER
jgi:hypothetical protein